MSNRISAVLLAVAVALGVTTATTDTNADGGFVIVCNSTNPVTALSASELKQALTGNTKQWGNGAVVQVGVSSSETPELKFLAGSAGISATDLLARIQQQVFKGEMRKPVIVRSPAECLGLARSNPGAICAAAAGAPLPAGVKLVTIH